AGTLTKPLLIIGNYTGALPTVKLGGVTQVQDVDYFPSLRPSANELWITLNKNLTGAVNHLEITPGAAGCGPDVTTPNVTAPAAATVTQTLCM
ncbi:MAG TPA: hypothetical protein VGR00_05425, partial [Thermoanaerobaculia bacterium]|nr:hypothetical protein [Thermoanaerobaculia bacterium]